jgi:hypothetical protein
VMVSDAIFPEQESQPMVDVLSPITRIHSESPEALLRQMSQMLTIMARNSSRLFTRSEPMMGLEGGEIGKQQARPERRYLPRPKGQDSDQQRQEGLQMMIWLREMPSLATARSQSHICKSVRLSLERVSSWLL